MQPSLPSLLPLVLLLGPAAPARLTRQAEQESTNLLDTINLSYAGNMDFSNALQQVIRKSVMNT